MKPVHVMLVALVATILIVALAIVASPDAVPQQRPEDVEPMEYYAEDWIVYDTKQNVVCRDPYIRKDVKIIQCVSKDPVR